MTTGKFISQLEASIKKLESLIQSLQYSSFHPSKRQYDTLADLGPRLVACGTNLPIQVAALKIQRAEPSFEEGRKLISQAQLQIRDLIANAKLENRIIFARNIIYFFDGQRDSVVDSDATKARKQLTRERCDRICTLSPHGLIFWAVAFMPTMWTANLMSKDTFDYVFEHIESQDYQVWPPDIYHILAGLGAEEPLRGSQKFHEFLKAAEDDKREVQCVTRSRKRRRVSDGAASELLSLMQTRELVARTPDDQYTLRGSTSPNKTAEDSRQSHLAMNDQDNRLPLFQLPTNDQLQEPLSDTSLKEMNTYDVDQPQKTCESISTVGFGRIGIGTINAVLNHDNNASTTALTATPDSLQRSEAGRAVSGVADKVGASDTQTRLDLDPVLVSQQSDAASEGLVNNSLKVIQFEKRTLYQIVLERPTDILGGIWFGCPEGLLPSITLRLSRALSNIVKASSREVYIDRPSPDASGIVTGIFLIELGCFRQMIQRDGFGEPFWNECGEEVFVTMQVLDAGLVEDFIRVAAPD